MRSINMVCSGLVAVCLLMVIYCTKDLSGIRPDTYNDIQSVEADRDALAIIYMPGDADRSVTQNVGLPKKGINGSTISWVTNNSSIVTIDGIVIRPVHGSGDAWVWLTATISKGDYSDELVFRVTVKELDSIVRGIVTDIDGNIYTTVKIGNQEWMAENLRVTRYNDKSAISHITEDSIWASFYGTPTPAYCFYNNSRNADSIKKFGALYNWFAVNTGKLAPQGWHVPNAHDWNVLKQYMVLNGSNWDGTTDTTQENRIAKSLAAKTDWSTAFSTSTHFNGEIGWDLIMNNKSGFSALPGGMRFLDGTFNNSGYEGFWWSSTALDTGNNYFAWNLFSGQDFLGISTGVFLKCSGFSVRLVRD